MIHQPAKEGILYPFLSSPLIPLDNQRRDFLQYAELEAVENGTIDPTKIGLAGKIHKLSIRGIVNRLQSFIRKGVLKQ